MPAKPDEPSTFPSDLPTLDPTPLEGLGSGVAVPAEPAHAAADVPAEAVADADSVQMCISAPWRYSSFSTPAVPGYTLTPEWQSYPRDVAQKLYSEAVRCSFTVSASEDLTNTSEGDA